MSKKKDQEKFTEYSINTDDAWEIDDNTMSLNILDSNFNDNSEICKQTNAEVPPRTANQQQSSTVVLDSSAVRKPTDVNSSTYPGIIRRVDDNQNLKASLSVRYTNNSNPNSFSTANITRSNLATIVDVDQPKQNKFKEIFDQSTIDLEKLRKTSWNGITKQYRAQAWKLLCGYLPPKVERREDTLTRKRDEYWSYVSQYYHTRTDKEHQDTFRQIHIDIPRMSPLMAIFQQVVVQELFERILFIWAIRHPASGYVQGINDLLLPFFAVFLAEFINNDVDIEHFNIDSLSESNRRIIEADSYWATSYLLEGIQDNYTFAQPGIQYKVRTLEELIKRIDEPLYRHLKNQNIEFLQFAFRWMNNLLMRELPVRCTIRLWDTYLAEQDGFSHFHLYICAAFLIRFSKDLLREKDFHGLLLLLQNLPTQSWTSNDISILTAEAYQLKVMFANAPRHLSNS
ncbi:unnamed protein product [Rotaria magnacalcarata]|uniref:Rab-GAP TBC domain-containing protein n=6 Tax=Rotaria magnacalcarata TaxID=392030 RepID=A0A815EUS5_9BILA|nr:unnamed protein product [Rotaria magnacalcarata]CAF1542753.1 unnamed protein product [Rotaria magnacalcarata]CAF2047287.1 unnamed protein product [Rotaria magnacalcarata]CAF2086241.1 unnamed protein product [Rotaria magnacalcarata]CAF2113405.1 unnamed protein product [Rotaria magnacalcarata]